MTTHYTSFLPFLEYFRKIGIFPCQKIEDNEVKKSSLKPTNCKIQLLIYSFILLTLSGFCLFAHWTILNSVECEDVFEVYKVAVAMQHSEYDYKVSLVLFVFPWIIHIILIISLVSSKQDLCNVYNFLQEEAKNDIKASLRVKHICNWHLTKLGLVPILGWGLCIIGWSLNIIQHFQLPILTVLPYGIHFYMSFLWFLAPLFAFHIYFLDISILLIPWTLSLREKLKIAGSHDVLLMESNKLLVTIEMICKAISKTIFWLFTLVMVAIVFGTYITIAFFLNQDEFNLPVALNMLGLAGIVGFYLKLGHGYCNFSQDINDSIHGIKKALFDLDINPEQVLIMNDKSVRAKHLQKSIVSGLDEFRGFHGNNYFVLSKSLLTSISANFMTYLIILIQFKVSESSQK